MPRVWAGTATPEMILPSYSLFLRKHGCLLECIALATHLATKTPAATTQQMTIRSTQPPNTITKKKFYRLYLVSHNCTHPVL